MLDVDEINLISGYVLTFCNGAISYYMGKKKGKAWKSSKQTYVI